MRTDRQRQDAHHREGERVSAQVRVSCGHGWSVCHHDGAQVRPAQCGAGQQIQPRVQAPPPRRQLQHHAPLHH